jgi:hypothetical protein
VVGENFTQERFGATMFWLVEKVGRRCFFKDLAIGHK